MYTYWGVNEIKSDKKFVGCSDSNNGIKTFSNNYLEKAELVSIFIEKLRNIITQQKYYLIDKTD